MPTISRREQQTLCRAISTAPIPNVISSLSTIWTHASTKLPYNPSISEIKRKGLVLGRSGCGDGDVVWFGSQRMPINSSV
jgi:hypothetical protein